MFKKIKVKKNIKSIIFFAPSIFLLCGFFIGPMLLTVVYSFTNISLTGSSANALQFIGFKNFVEIFKDPKFSEIIVNSLIFLIISGIIGQQVLGFLVAALMKKRNKTIRRIVGFTIVAGWITPEIVAAFMFSAFFADKGVLNSVVSIFGVSPISWIFTFPMVCVIIANIWKGTAYSMMMFQAALDNIPDDIIESAKIDGANAFQILINITLPIIKSSIATTFIIVTLATLGAFGLIFAITGGGPGTATTTLSIFMYQKAFISYQIGYGMAIALFILLLGSIFSIVYTRIIKFDL